MRSFRRLAGLLLLGLPLLAAAPPDPATFEYPLHIRNADRRYRNPVALEFRIYADSLGGAPLWQEAHQVTLPPSGDVAPRLGSRNPLSAALRQRPVLWLEIRIGTDITPRRRRLETVMLPTGAAANSTTGWDPVPPERISDSLARLCLIDFGPEGQGTPNRTSVGAETRGGAFAWCGGPVRSKTRALAAGGPFYCDFIEGHDATFKMAVTPPGGTFRCDLTFGDPREDRGPGVLLHGEQVLATVPRTRAGEPRRVSVELAPVDGVLSLRVQSADCRPWALVGLDVYGPPGARLGRLTPAPEPGPAVPPPATLAAVTPDSLRGLLRACGRFLLAERLTDGGFSFHGAWYQNAYPVRTLLLGSALIDEPAWREAAFEVLDRFVSEQRPDGGWYSGYEGPRECGGSFAPDSSSANLADIGTMSLCLALAAPLADSARAAGYVAAARRYADRVVLPAQLPTGAFPNGRYAGKVYRHPYSVATATQAGSLAALGQVTGDPRYAEAAARAGAWLAAQVAPEGRVTFYPHDGVQTKTLEATAFGDVFYVAEALTFLERIGATPEVREAARQALDRLVWGRRGLHARAVAGYWWNPGDGWSDAKMGGMLYVLAETRRWDTRPELGPWLDRAVRWLATPRLATRIGVRAPLESDSGLYGTVATGLAGIGLVDLLDPGALVAVVPGAGAAGYGVPTARRE